MIESRHDIETILASRINMPEISEVVRWANTSERKMYLFNLVKNAKDRIGTNALWCMTHMMDTDAEWLHSLQNELVDMLLIENHTGRKRMFLQLLKGQTYNPETIRTDFLDYCLSKINSECETYAIRCFSMYCAWEMCKHYPELTEELTRYLDMLETQSLSSGLMSGLRTTRKNIKRHLRRSGVKYQTPGQQA